MKFKLTIAFIAVAAIVAAGTPQPASAQGFFESLRRLFAPPKPRRRVVVRRAPRLPVVTFAYAHQAGKYRRYRYSHHTPYAYYRHPYRHGFSYAYVAPRRKRPRRRRQRSNFRQEYRFMPDGRIKRVF